MARQAKLAADIGGTFTDVVLEHAGARVVVSGGRGLGSGENFKLLEPLADKLGAINIANWSGGVNWPGSGFDPETGNFYTQAMNTNVSIGKYEEEEFEQVRAVFFAGEPPRRRRVRPRPALRRRGPRRHLRGPHHPFQPGARHANDGSGHGP